MAVPNVRGRKELTVIVFGQWVQELVGPEKLPYLLTRPDQLLPPSSRCFWHERTESQVVN